MIERLTISGAHPVMRDHHVLRRPLLPGLAYIDLLYQMFRKHGYDYRETELRDLTIYRPLTVVHGGSVVLDVLIEDNPGGGWQITVQARRDASIAQSAKQVPYATAEMYRIGTTAFGNESIDLPAIRASARQNIDLEDIYRVYRQHGLNHGAYMKVSGNAYTTDAAVYVDCRLTPEALDGAHKAMFHPALIDGSAVCGGAALMLDRKEADRPLALPLYYKSFKASALLNDCCVARIARDSTRQSNDIGYCTIEFFDSAGKKVAELTDLAGKTVRDAASFGKQTQNRHSNNGNATKTSSTEGGDANESKGSLPKNESFELQSFLRGIIASHLQAPIDSVDCAASFYDLGVDSAGLLSMVTEIESTIHASLPPTLLFEYTTIAGLAKYLTEQYGLEGKTALPAGTAEPLTLSAPQRAAYADDDIAIVALDGRYPGSNTPAALWANLVNGKDCVVEVPVDRWPLDGFYEPNPELALLEGKSYCKWGGFFSSEEDLERGSLAARVDDLESPGPEFKACLQIIGSLFAGVNYSRSYIEKTLGNSVGVYLGAMADGVGDARPSELANAVSSVFGLQGPSVAVDTMSSSSITAIHMACEALKRNECRAAVAGGIYLLRQSNFISLSRHKLLGSHPASRSFSNGDGLLLSETIGAVLLKTLGNALKDNDKVLAVIKASTINHAGNQHGSFGALKELICATLDKAAIHPQTISYVEASANGSLIADALEIGVLTKIFAEQGVKRSACTIGSVKSNIGHAAAASGISQLTKVILQLQERRFAPSIKSEIVNSNLRLDESPFVLQRCSTEWQRPCTATDGISTEWPRRALINSLGAGGSYASLIVEEYAQSDSAVQSLAG